MSEDLSTWTIEKLHRKMDQEYQMFSLAASEGDHRDAAERMSRIRLYQAEINGRR